MCFWVVDMSHPSLTKSSSNCVELCMCLYIHVCDCPEAGEPKGHGAHRIYDTPELASPLSNVITVSKHYKNA